MEKKINVIPTIILVIILVFAIYELYDMIYWKPTKGDPITVKTITQKSKSIIEKGNRIKAEFDKGYCKRDSIIK
jgi:hypothetical protein